MLRLSDEEGRTFDYAANFAVAARLAVSTLLLKPGKVGKLYRSRVAATGGVLPKAWRITAGKLPKGVRFDRKLGLLSGTPTKAGRYRLTFQVPTASRSSRRRRSASTFCRRARRHGPGARQIPAQAGLSGWNDGSRHQGCGPDRRGPLHRRQDHAELAHAPGVDAFVDPRPGYPKRRGGARLIDGLARHAQVAPAPPQVIADRSVCPD